MSLASLFLLTLTISLNAFALPGGTYNSVYYKYVPGDGIGVGRFVPRYWERQYLFTISGNNYRLEEAYCSRSGRPSSQGYVEQGYFVRTSRGLFSETFNFYRADGSLRRTCTVKDGSAQPSASEVFSMDCGNDWRWSFETSKVSAGYEFCKPW